MDDLEHFRNIAIDLAGSTYADRIEVHRVLQLIGAAGFHQQSSAIFSPSSHIKALRYATYDSRLKGWRTRAIISNDIQVFPYKTFVKVFNPTFIDFRKLGEC